MIVPQIIPQTSSVGSIEIEPMVFGIGPKLLISQIYNTAPFWKDYPLTAGAHTNDESSPEFFLQRLRFLERRHKGLEETGASLDLVEYFELCWVAHFSTVATLVPTDVDAHIRYLLWKKIQNEEQAFLLYEKVAQWLRWNCHVASDRWVKDSATGQCVSGHDGEWFSVAAGALGFALSKGHSSEAEKISELIIGEVERENQVIESMIKQVRSFAGTCDPIDLLKASCLVTHNMGDLDRILEQWNALKALPALEAVYKRGHVADDALSGTVSFSGLKLDGLAWAGLLNKQFMALENHRHLPMRACRPLRKSRDFIIPMGPFFEAWGRKVAKHPVLEAKEVGQVVEALVDGQLKLPETVGYARALKGIIEGFSGGESALKKLVPSRCAREMTSGSFKQKMLYSQAAFEDSWRNGVIKFLKRK